MTLTKLSEKSLQPRQLRAIERITKYKATVLVAPTGAGKTVICLSSVKRNIRRGKLSRVIVACPPKVVGVWPKEAARWEHLEGVTVRALEGTPAQREKALRAGADVVVVSLNNLEGLLALRHGADGIIIDELSKAAGKQTRKLNTKRWGGMFKWRVGMTATPVSQDFEKLHPMCRIIDGGKSLGTNKQDYLTKYFVSDYLGYNWTLRDGADNRIMGKIKPLVHLIEDTKAAELPPLRQHTVRFDMPVETRKTYIEMRRHMVVDDVEAVNAAVRDGKLRQLASGFLYNEDKEVRWLDTARRDAAVDWWLSIDKRPAVIFYEFVAQGEKLKRVFKRYMTTDVEGFLKGSRPVLISQIASLSHGVDGLQHVAHHALMYHPMWSRDAVEQAIGRLWRTGVRHPVNITTLVCDDTLDDAVLARVEGRGEWMELFVKHMKGEQDGRA